MMSESGPPGIQRPIENNEFIRARELVPHHEFVPFHRRDLPDLLCRHGPLVVDDLAGVPPLAFSQPSGESFTYESCKDGVHVVPGVHDAETVVELDEDMFSDFVNEIHSASGLVLAQKIRFLRGDLEKLHRWEPALRALFQGRRIWTAEEARTLVDEAGTPLDLARTFTPADSDQDMRAFLEVAGFLHLRAVFDADEVAVFADEVDRVRAALKPGQGDCWWSTTGSGEQVITRINYLDRWSEKIKEASWESRIQRFGRLLGDHYRVCDDRLDGPMAFIKNSDVAQGLGDLKWHQDDGLGGHPVMCPLMQVGVQLDRADAENGQLFVLAGSHRYSNHPMEWGEEDGQPVVRFETEPGDVTVHFGDIFHTTPPPTGERAGRRVLYYKFAEPKTFDAIPAGAHYNDLLFKAGAGGRVATRAETWSEGDTQDSLPAASERRG